MKQLLTFGLGLASCTLTATTAFAADLNDPGLPVETAATAASSAGFNNAIAQDETSSEGGADELKVAFTPYLWMPSIKGDVAIPRGQDEAEVDQSFSDILGNLKFAFMGTLDAQYRRVVVHTDVMYLSLGADVERVDSPIFSEGEFDAKILVATGALGYRVIDRGPMFVDLYAGGRLVSLDIELALEGPLQTREADASPSNVSPLIGGKVRFPLSDRWAIALQGDIGFDSDVKWQLVGNVQYQLSNHWLAGVGYRHLALHHDADESEFDIALSGPLIAFTYTF